MTATEHVTVVVTFVYHAAAEGDDAAAATGTGTAIAATAAAAATTTAAAATAATAAAATAATAAAATSDGANALRARRVIDIPVSTSIADFLCVYVHGSGLCSVPMGAACHYQVLHEVTRVPLTDDHLDSLGNRWASLSPPRVRVRLSPVLTSPTWHPLKRARFGECREHPILFAVSVKNLYDALSNLPDAALKSSEY